MEDNRILKLYAERSERAIAETERKYGRYCYSIAVHILQSDEDAAECVNDTYLRAWNAIPPQHPRCLRTFLGKITRNLSLNRYEKQTAEKRGKGQIPLVLDELAECLPDTKGEAVLESMVIRSTLNRFMKELPAETRRLFVQRYWYLCSVKEIAENNALTDNQVAVTLFRARCKLKLILEQEGIVL